MLKVSSLLNYSFINNSPFSHIKYIETILLRIAKNELYLIIYCGFILFRFIIDYKIITLSKHFLRTEVIYALFTLFHCAVSVFCSSQSVTL